jgi:dynein heavy chain 1
VRIVFEVEHLRYATLATVSRCGMIWFSDDSVKPSMLFANYLGSLRSTELGSDDDDALTARRLGGAAASALNDVSPNLLTQRVIADAIAPFFERGALVELALEYAAGVFHIMDFIVARALSTLFSLVNKTARNVADYNALHPDFPLSVQQVQSYATKRLIVGLVWAFTGDSKLDVRAQMGEFLRDNTGLELPPLGNGASLIDYDVQVSTGEWFEWASRVPTVEIETHAVASADVVIPTMDTVRHEEVLYSWLSEHKPLMLCGPPGSGKTMTLFSALRKLPDQEVVGLNFSSATTPELILNTFEQYCEYRKTPNGVVLSPQQMGRWIVLFCDEINLPARDNYGTQRVISFLRQLVECGGFWRASDLAWVTLERIQFVGACNPPTDPGRVPLSHRFLRHAPLVMVDYPGEVSLNQIYGTFNRALLKLTPNLRGYAEALTSAMVDFFLASQRRFTPDIQAHYVYSPRELSRWVRGLYEHLKPIDDTVTLEGLVRVWAHEGLRLFRDRLVGEDEKGE